MNDSATQRAATPGLAVCGVVLLALGVGIRMMTSMDPFPGWSGDPLMMETPIVGLTPASSLGVDGLIALAAGLVLAGMARAGVRPRWWEVLLTAGGLGACAWHALSSGGSLQNLVLGASWSAGMLAGLAACVGAQDERLRRLLSAVMLALVVPLLLRGIVQVAVEHPDVVEAFRKDKSAILASHGWSEDSPMARAYERRLNQAEASGWFGLANVYATVMAASAAGCLGMALGSGRRGGFAANLALFAGAGCGIAGVLIAGSKGGWGACGLGVGLVITALAGPARWRARAAALVGVGVVAAALAAVVVRGLVGERLPELSLLFRWFYMEGAARVIARWPFAGVGPTGFKEAYALLKPPISPEDVSSPHSVLLDFASTLGLGGVMWGAAWLAWVRRAGMGLMGDIEEGAERTPEGPATRRPDLSLAAIMLVVPTLAGSLLEQAMASPTTALVRVGGVVLGLGLAAAVLWRGEGRGLRIGLAAAALAAAAHAQIEMTAITPGACAWLMVLIGLAGIRGPACRERRVERLAGVGRFAGAGLCVLTALGIGLEFPRVMRWEEALRRAYEDVRIVAELESRMRQVDSGGGGDSRAKIIEDLALALREPMLLSRSLTRDEVVQAVLRLRRDRAEAALSNLRRAAAQWPTDLPTVQALSRLELLQASHLKALGAKSPDVAAAARRSLDAANLYRGPRGASAWSWLGTTNDAVATLTSDPALLAEAVRCWEHAAVAAPHAVLHPLQLARACVQLGRKPDAAKWAAIALANDAKSRLDPLAGLGDAAKREMEALVKAN